jgi:hypothetical protein
MKKYHSSDFNVVVVRSADCIINNYILLEKDISADYASKFIGDGGLKRVMD